MDNFYQVCTNVSSKTQTGLLEEIAETFRKQIEDIPWKVINNIHDHPDIFRKTKEHFRLDYKFKNIPKSGIVIFVESLGCWASSELTLDALKYIGDSIGAKYEPPIKSDLVQEWIKNNPPITPRSLSDMISQCSLDTGKSVTNTHFGKLLKMAHPNIATRKEGKVTHYFVS